MATPGGRRTRRVLGRFAARLNGRSVHVGKESNRLEERMREEVQQETEYLNLYIERECACACGEPTGLCLDHNDVLVLYRHLPWPASLSWSAWKDHSK